MKLRIAYLVAVVDSVTVLSFVSPAFAKHVFLSAVPLLALILAVMLAVGTVAFIVHGFAKLVLPERYCPWVVAALLVGATQFAPKSSFFMYVVWTVPLVVTAALILTFRKPGAYREEP